jgi:hypothetical protein
MTSVETSEEGADQPTYQARIRVAHNHSIGPVEERQAERHRDFEKNLKRNGYRVSLASITLAAALGAWSIPCASQDGERPSGRNVFPTKVIRTHRPHLTDAFFKQEAVRFERTVAIRSARRPRGDGGHAGSAHLSPCGTYWRENQSHAGSSMSWSRQRLFAGLGTATSHTCYSAKARQSLRTR